MEKNVDKYLENCSWQLHNTNKELRQMEQPNHKKKIIMKPIKYMYKKTYSFVS